MAKMSRFKLTEKVCKECNEVKPVTAFYRHDGMRDGYSTRCTVCTNRIKKIRRHIKIGKIPANP